MYENILYRITSQLPLTQNQMRQLPIGLFNGLGGVALLLAVLSKLMLADKYRAALGQVVKHILYRINHESIDITFGEGLAGLGWLFKYLYNNSFIPKYQLSIFNVLDSLVLERIYQYGSDYNLDFIYGNTGNALYLLSRLPSPFIKSGLEDYIRSAIQTKTVEDDGTIRWIFERKIDDQNMKVTDISLSHGMSAILIMLNKIREQKIGAEETSILIRLGIQFILSQKNTNNHTSLYPSYCRDIESKLTFSRLAWCYGDLCVANMLNSVIKLDYNESYANELNAILLHTNTRLSEASSLCNETNFCHGFSGVLYILYKLKYAHNYSIISDNSILYWTESLLKRLDEEICSEANEIKNWGLLQGMSGIALVLLSISHSYYEWDECFLLS